MAFAYGPRRLGRQVALVRGCVGQEELLAARSTRPDLVPVRRSSGRSSGVEHNLAKVGVEGSNPFARSSFWPCRGHGENWSAHRETMGDILSSNCRFKVTNRPSN